MTKIIMFLKGIKEAVFMFGPIIGLGILFSLWLFLDDKKETQQTREIEQRKKMEELKKQKLEEFEYLKQKKDNIKILRDTLLLEQATWKKEREATDKEHKKLPIGDQVASSLMLLWYDMEQTGYERNKREVIEKEIKELEQLQKQFEEKWRDKNM